MATTQEMIDAATKNMTKATDFQFLSKPADDIDPATFQQQQMDSIKEGQSLSWNRRVLNPASVDQYNAQLANVNAYNTTAYQDAIQRVGEQVSHNISAAEKTEQLLKGTSYEDQPFFGGSIAKPILLPGEDPNMDPALQHVKHSTTPMPVFVDKSVNYAKPDEFKPVYDTYSGSAKKAFPPSRTPSATQPDPIIKVENLNFDPNNPTKGEKNIDLNDYSIASATNSPISFGPILSDMAALNLETVTGKNQLAESAEFIPSDIYNSYTGRTTKDKITGITQGQKILYYLTDKLAQRHDALKQRGQVDDVWGQLEEGTVIGTGAGIRTGRVAWNIADKINYGGKWYPKILVQSQGGEDIADGNKVARIYQQWRATQPSSYKPKTWDEDMKNFTQSLGQGAVTTYNNGNADEAITKTTIMLKPALKKAISEIAQQFYEDEKVQADPTIIGRKYRKSKADQFNVGQYQIIMEAALSGQPIKNGYSAVNIKYKNP